MNRTHGFSVTKPVSFWNKPLKVNFKDLFKSITKAAAYGVAGSWGSAAKEAVDALSTIGLGVDCGETAWLLIHRSLIQALYTLIEENEELLFKDIADSSVVHHKPGVFPEDIEALCRKLDLSLEDNELTIDEDFFRRPGDLSLLREIKTPFAQWLELFNFTKSQAESIADRLPSYFVFALNDQWRSRPQDYECLREGLNTPFTKASEKEQSWLRYSAWLQKQIDERLFSEAFSLRQVYVPLRAYYYKELEPIWNEGFEDKKIESETTRIVVDLEKELESWLDKDEAHDSIRVISGGPGSGKSSFTKMLAAQQCLRGKRRVLYVPLHHFELSNDVVHAISSFVRYERFLNHNPLDPEDGDSRLFIIFDGLDELAMQGRIAAEIAQQFVYEVQKKAYQFNLSESRLKVLISGRELAIQANVSEFRVPKQILYLLPYYYRVEEDETLDRIVSSNSESEYRSVRVKIVYEDPSNLLKLDQRDAWWKLYGNVTGKNYDGIPGQLRRAALIDVTSQPLLNYLVALSLNRGKVNLAIESNLNAIYEDLLKSVYHRVWAEHQHPALKDLQEEQFIRILEEIAVAAWHGDGRTTTVKEIEAYCESSGLKTLIERFKEGASKGVARLLLAFYFRQSGFSNAGDQTFEFTHKSFGEYLASRRIIRVIERMYREVKARQRSIDEGWDEQTALTYWIGVCGPISIDKYILGFMHGEVRQQGKATVSKWQECLVLLIEFMLRNGIPMERLQPRPSYREESRQARNAEEALLVALNACAQFTMDISEIQWPTLTTFGTWISKLQEQKKATEGVLFLSCLSFLNLEGCILDNRNLSGADFNHSNLKDVSLISANLSMAKLYETQLAGAKLQDANLSAADLTKSNLEAVNFYSANLFGANLEGAFIEAVNLKYANLEDADLDMAILRGADLQKANLTDAHLRCANLRNANLEKANLERAYLVTADLKEANLDRANLEDANFEEANLENANLNNAIMIRTKLSGANLKSANLEGTNLKDATLKKSNLSFAYLREANLNLANLEEASLENANLGGANLVRANLKGASLQGANLEDANLEGANLEKTNLVEANLERTNFRGANYNVWDLTK